MELVETAHGSTCGGYSGPTLVIDGLRGVTRITQMQLGHLLTPSFPLPGGGMSFNVHRVASHPLDVKHDTYIFFIAWICFCFIYQSIQFINEQFWFSNQGFMAVFNQVFQTIDGDKSCHQSRVRFSFAKLTSISLTLETFNLLIWNMLWDLCVFWIGPSLKWGPAQSAS